MQKEQHIFPATMKFCVVEQNVHCWRKHKELLLKVTDGTQQAYCGPDKGN